MTPFLTASQEVLAQFLGETVAIGEVTEKPKMFACSPITVLLGIVGHLRGQLIIGYTDPVALYIAGTMMMTELEEMDDMARSALSELGNMIGGNAVRLLEELGYATDVTTPTIMRGNPLELITQSRPLTCTLTGSFGEIVVSVVLSD